MIKRSLSALALCLLALPAWAQSEPQALPESVLVVGQKPGPGLWKVSRGDHVLWVFGSYAPLPRKMQWRAQQVESILAQSQELITLPGWSAHVGLLRGLTLLPFAYGLTKNPDGATLKEVLPADVYARWLPLKAKYLGEDNGIERERPIFVADKLYRMGLEKSGLTMRDDVRDAVFQIAKKNKLAITSTQITLDIDSPGQAMKDFKKAQLDDTACLSLTMERLESDLDAMRLRANAWAKGDIGAIRALSFADRDGACDGAVFGSAVFKAQRDFKDIEARVRSNWMAAAEKALAANKSSFALLPLKDLLDPQGYLAALQAKGYQVESPE
ncbi:MAG: TraB/GumN family protein [Pseudomonadota bacterium]